MKINEIVLEAFDKSYTWEPSSMGPRSEKYFIDLPTGHEIAVTIVLEKGKEKPEVEFMSTDYDPEDIHKMTGTFAKEGINPIRVFTALIEILKKSALVSKHRGFTMSALKSEASRVDLYRKLLTKFGYKFTTYDDEIHNRSLKFDVVAESEKRRIDQSCWDGYKVGDPKTKTITKNGKKTRVNNCVKEGTYRYSGKTGRMEYDDSDPDQRHGIYINGELVQTFNTRDEAERAKQGDRRFMGAEVKKLQEETYHGNSFFEEYGWISLSETLMEAEYQGRKVTLNKPMRGDVKKFKVYVKDPKTGNVKKVNFGDPDMKIKKSNPERRKSFRARHKCDQKKDKTTAGYWSCKKW